jgi:hypothetical protein
LLLVPYDDVILALIVLPSSVKDLGTPVKVRGS